MIFLDCWITSTSTRRKNLVLSITISSLIGPVREFPSLCLHFSPCILPLLQPLRRAQDQFSCTAGMGLRIAYGPAIHLIGKYNNWTAEMRCLAWVACQQCSHVHFSIFFQRVTSVRIHSIFVEFVWYFQSPFSLYIICIGTPCAAFILKLCKLLAHARTVLQSWHHLCILVVHAAVF